MEETRLQDERHEVTDKGITENCDIVTKFKLFEEFQLSVEKKLLEPETTYYQAVMGKLYRRIMSVEIL